MKECKFCQIVKGEVKSWKVYEDRAIYAFFDIHPVNLYHTLIIPKKHYKDIFEIPEGELRKLISVVKKLTTVYHEKVGIENVQIISCSGTSAQQSVFHLHFHIVPMHKGDPENIKWIPKDKLVKEFDQLLEALE